MAEQLAQPGVYVEEVSGGVRTITPAATSVTAFVGRAARGPVDRPVTVTGLDCFEREFGGLWPGSRLGFAVRDFFLNGGSQAVICRLYVPPSGGSGVSRLTWGQGSAAMALDAASPGLWGNSLRARVDTTGAPPGELFTLVVTDLGRGTTERHAGVSLYGDHPRCVRTVLERESALARSTLEPLDPPAAGTARVRPAASAAWEGDVGARDAAVAAAAAAVKDAVAKDAAAGPRADAAKAAAQRATAAGAAAVAAQQAAQDSADAAARALLDAQAAVDAAAKKDQGVPANAAELAAATAARDAAKKADESARTELTAKKQEAADAARRLEEAERESGKAAQAVLQAGSALDAARTALAGVRDAAARAAAALGGSDGDASPGSEEVRKQFARLLDLADLFNLLCIPPFDRDGTDVAPAVFDDAAAYCTRRRAVLLVDPPSSWRTASAAVDGFRAEADQLGGRGRNAAVFFPRLLQPDPFENGRIADFAPSGAVAGVLARTDGARGVWKAGAGIEAGLVGVPDLSVRLSDRENGLLNPLGVNCLRSFPTVGRVVWGARTLTNPADSEWRYLPVRRLALFIEESLFRGTQWVVFEPNGEALWGQVRLSVGAFMQQLFRQGALQGSSPRDAYFVKCDAETTTQADRDLGVVNIRVGFAPLKPAEFVVVQIQQMSEATPS
ncbi:phage tail sheath subtilisin-like domain-containing protein [Streptomyces hirsutus]|uniref:phage tail sheath family protein n=1 Tax=Streptomyces hirsutus TaxID=35620 RepID=UPI003869E5E4|nr:phage tail sheath subtilisin-like domain-containing protein [Streptomyces hirsutus]